MDIMKRHMNYFGIEVSIAGMKQYMELDIAK
jgi:hypothetical protein